MFVSPAVAGNRLIVASCAGSVHALERDSGKTAWTYDTAEDGPRAQFHGDAVVVGNRVIVPSDAEPSASLYAFDAATGKVQWRMEFEGGVATTPLLAGGSVIVGSATGRVARIDLESGKASWNVAPDGARSSMPRIPAPAADAKRVYFASNEPRLYALDLATGAVVWKKELAARIDTSLALHGHALHAGATDGHLYAFDPASGELRRRIALGGRPTGTLVVAPPLVLTLVFGKPHKLVAVDTAADKVLWERAAEREWSTMKPLVHDGAVIAGTEAKDLCAFALTDGQERWCTTLPQVARGLGEAGGTLYVGTLNGRVMAFRKGGKPTSP